MRSISVPDQIYALAQEDAVAGGVSVSAYVVGLIAQAAKTDPEDYGHIFTAEVVRELDQISEAAKAGKPTFSLEEVDASLAATRAAWLEKRHN